MRTMRARLTALGSALGLAVALIAAIPPSGAQVPSTDADYGGYSTGTVIHADALEAGETRLADVEVAFSGAAAESTGLTEVLNEVNRQVVPGDESGNSYGRGSGLEIGLGVTAEDDNQVIAAGLAEATAPPSTDLITEEIGPLPADPLAYASLLRGQAQARWNDPACVLGADISHGLGYAADVQLLDTDGTPDEEGDDPTLEAPVIATDTADPERTASQSTSHLRMVSQVAQDGTVEGDALGLMSETRMTIAPVTLFRENGGVTIEFLGEWVLRAVATGHSGYVHYGPGEVSPETTILRTVDETTGEVTNIVTFQDFFESDGLVIPIEELGIEIAIGEDPRAIGGDAESAPTETATEASAAVDVARIRLLDGGELSEALGVTATDLRIGHMEVEARVPAGGISCELPVEKTVDPQTVNPGDSFTYTITVDNPFDCTLENVRIVDQVSAEEGVTFEIDGASDGGVISGDTVTWENLGSIEPGDSRSVTIDLSAGADSGPGIIIDDITATATCAIGDAAGESEVDVPLSGATQLRLPEVAGETVEQARGVQEPLPATGGSLLAGVAAMALISGAAAMRRFFRVR